MSAYVVDMALIRYLIGAATGLDHNRDFHWHEGRDGCGPYRTLHAGDDLEAARAGQMLWNENVRSVRHRYPDSAPGELPGGIEDGECGYLYEHRPWRDPQWNPVQVLKAIACLEYQSCEHQGWPDSEAFSFLEALRHRAICRLPGWDAAEWGAPVERTSIVSLAALARGR